MGHKWLGFGRSAPGALGGSCRTAGAGTGCRGSKIRAGRGGGAAPEAPSDWALFVTPISALLTIALYPLELVVYMLCGSAKLAAAALRKLAKALPFLLIVYFFHNNFLCADAAGTAVSADKSVPKHDAGIPTIIPSISYNANEST